MQLELSKEILYQRGGAIDALLNNSFDQALIIDANKRIIFFSKSSELHSGQNAQDVIGKPIDTLIKNHKFDEVLKTGIADKGSMLVINDRISIANHIPVSDKGEIIGAIGIVYFSDLSTIKKLFLKLSDKSKLEDETLYNSISRHDASYTFHDYIGKSNVVKMLIENVKRAAASNYPILLIGETGTGKEILANAIHSENQNTFLQPFIKINCSSIPNNLLEAELFGYEKGAFTGATAMKKGKFEIANHGSILLDEIGEMDILLQSKLLRVLEEKEFERVGGNTLLPTNARVIASTNAHLLQLCKEKKFRHDLYYRLNTLEIHVPPLRSRMEDIPLLVNHFVEANQFDIKFRTDALDLLMQYSWPGNVRELRNLVNRFGVLKTNAFVDANDVLYALQEQQTSDIVSQTRSETPLNSNHPSPYSKLEMHEKSAIEDALKSHHYNQTQTAAFLKIARTTLIRKIKKYNIELI